MFVEQIEFQVRPEKLAEWEVYVRTCLAALAREPGGVSFRMLRDLDWPQRNKLISLRSWISKGVAERSRTASPEATLAAAPSREGGFYTGMPMTRTEHSLWDMVWGLAGPERFVRRGGFLQRLKSGFGPGKEAQWTPYARNFVSVFARQPGVVALELLRPVEGGNRYVAVRTYLAREDARAGPEAQPSAELRLAVEAGQQLKVYEGGPGVAYTNCEVVDALWGAAGQEAYHRYMRSLRPA